MSETIYEAGFERDRIGDSYSNDPGHVIRWWFYVWIPGARLRNQSPRLGVVDRGFRFARGGRSRTADDAGAMLRLAHEEARREAVYWRGQPSHALGAAGELIPLDEVLPELRA